MYHFVRFPTHGDYEIRVLLCHQLYSTCNISTDMPFCVVLELKCYEVELHIRLYTYCKRTSQNRYNIYSGNVSIPFR